LNYSEARGFKYFNTAVNRYEGENYKGYLEPIGSLGEVQLFLKMNMVGYLEQLLLDWALQPYRGVFGNG
jgi:hypothetical protein